MAQNIGGTSPLPEGEADRHLADPDDNNVWRCVSCMTDFYFKPDPRPDYCPNCGGKRDTSPISG